MSSSTIYAIFLNDSISCVHVSSKMAVNDVMFNQFITHGVISIHKEVPMDSSRSCDLTKCSTLRFLV